MKRCGKCGALLPYEGYYRRTASKDGLQHWCKACQKGYMRLYVLEHPAEPKMRNRATGKAENFGQYVLFQEEDKERYMVRFNINDHNEVLNVLTLLKRRGVIRNVEFN